MNGIQDRSRNGLTVTRLFHHGSEHTPEGLVDRISERVRLFDAPRRLIDTTSPAPA